MQWFNMGVRVMNVANHLDVNSSVKITYSDHIWLWNENNFLSESAIRIKEKRNLVGYGVFNVN